jgi:uncharacterized protein YgiB involved in biofilm formation
MDDAQAALIKAWIDVNSVHAIWGADRWFRKTHRMLHRTEGDVTHMFYQSIGECYQTTHDYDGCIAGKRARTPRGDEVGKYKALD